MGFDRMRFDYGPFDRAGLIEHEVTLTGNGISTGITQSKVITETSVSAVGTGSSETLPIVIVLSQGIAYGTGFIVINDFIIRVVSVSGSSWGLGFANGVPVLSETAFGHAIGTAITEDSELYLSKLILEGEQVGQDHCLNWFSEAI